MKWQPIETAPRDGTKVDLWVKDYYGRWRRLADAYYVQAAQSKYVERDGWWAPCQDYEDDGYCDEQNEITHWMPLPEPPDAA